MKMFEFDSKKLVFARTEGSPTNLHMQTDQLTGQEEIS
jgi:hypothetical protein